MNSTIEHAGYIFNFQAHGAFDPNGKIDGSPTQAEIDEHNAKIAAMELEQLRQNGRGVLYSFVDTSGHSVGTWASKPAERFRVTGHTYSRNNFGARRMDVWFYIDGKRWHGVNLGDNDILRVKKNKH
jgi:hypothetical protein